MTINRRNLTASFVKVEEKKEVVPVVVRQVIKGKLSGLVLLLDHGNETLLRD